MYHTHVYTRVYLCVYVERGSSCLSLLGIAQFRNSRLCLPSSSAFPARFGASSDRDSPFFVRRTAALLGLAQLTLKRIKIINSDSWKYHCTVCVCMSRVFTYLLQWETRSAACKRSHMYVSVNVHTYRYVYTWLMREEKRSVHKVSWLDVSAGETAISTCT